jgi:transcriptional regulator with XRE-family HTH domain
MISRYAILGQGLAELRVKAGIATQVDLAKLVGVSQQSVSRWEAGAGRPRSEEILRLAAVLSTDAGRLLELAGYSKRRGATSFDRPFPLHALAPEVFESFCATVLHELHRDSNAVVHRVGKTGHGQDGVDITVKFPSALHTIQCKRVSRFGPSQFRELLRIDSVPADRKFVLLSTTASPALRREVTSIPKWDIWDQDDISRIVRSLPKISQRQIVDTYFRGQRFDLLGEVEAGPWTTLTQYFAPFIHAERLFNHTWALVGRQTESSALRKAISNPDKLVTSIVGIAGSGKSRLLLDLLTWFEATYPQTRVFVASSTDEITSRSLEELGPSDKLLVVDDAHDREDLAPLLRYVSETGSSRLLMALRPYGRDVIRNQAANFSIAGSHVEEIVVGRLTKHEATELAREVLRGSSHGSAVAKELAARTHDSPLATVVGAQIVSKGGLHPELLGNDKNFQQLVLSKFSAFLTGEIANSQDTDRLRAILRVLALVQPVSIDENDFLQLIESSETVVLADSSRLLRLLVDAGVLFKRGTRYRLSPDLLGDAILAESCLAVSGDSNGYAERLFDKAPAQYLQNILVNLGKFDWRRALGDTSDSRLLSGLWARLRWGDEYHNPHIEAAAAVAYYQPRQALTLARRLVQEGHGNDEDVCEMIKLAAYNYDYLYEGCELLWEAGHSDARRLNRYPHHAIRILKELAEPSPNKPREYVEQVVDFVLNLIPLTSGDSVYTPFDVLEGALATEGHTTSFTSRSMTLSPYAVSRDSMSPIRRRIIDALLNSMSSYDDRRAFLAAGTLGGALRAPHGLLGHNISAAERKAWTGEFTQTMQRLHQLLSTEQISPVVQVKAASSVAWHAFYGPDTNREPAQKIIGLLSRSLDTRVCRVLLDSWGHDTWDIDPDGPPPSPHEREMQDLVKILIAKFPDPEDLAQYLERMLGEINRLARVSSAHVFIGHVIRASPALADLIVRTRNKVGPLSEFAPLSFALLLEGKSELARKIVSSSTRLPTPDSLKLIAEAYARRTSLQFLDPVDIQVLQLIFSSSDPEILWMAAHVGREVARHNKSLAIELALRADFSCSPRATHEMFLWLAHEGTIPFSMLQDDQIEALIEKLRPLGELDDYWVIAFLKKAIQRIPSEVIELVKTRITESVASSDWRKRPLFHRHRGLDSLELLKVNDGRKCLVALLDWSLSQIEEALFAHHLGEAMGALCGHFDSAFVGVLEDWMVDGSLAHALVISAILREAQAEFIFEQEAAIQRILQRSRLMGKDGVEAIAGALYGSTISGVKSTTPGEPYPQDVRLRDYCSKMLEKLSRSDPAYLMYKELFDHADQEIRRQGREKEQLDAEDEDSGN